MILGKYTKQPNEVSDYDIDFGVWLRSGETAVSASAVATCTTGADTSLVVASVSVIDSNSVRVRLTGGADAQTYKVTVTTTTDAGRVDESEFVVKVKDF